MENKDFQKQIDTLSTRVDELVDKFSDEAVDFAGDLSDKVSDAVEATEYKVKPKKNKLEKYWWHIALSTGLSLAAVGVAVSLQAQKAKKKDAEAEGSKTVGADPAHTAGETV